MLAALALLAVEGGDIASAGWRGGAPADFVGLAGVPALALVACAGVWIGWLRPGRGLRSRRRPVVLGGGCLLVSAAWLYGALRGLNGPASGLPVGVPVTARAVVQAVYPVAGGESVYLLVYRTSAGPCAAEARLHWSRPAPGVVPVRAGEVLQLAGVFVPRTFSSAGGKASSGSGGGSGEGQSSRAVPGPVRAGRAPYDFHGRVAGVSRDPAGGFAAAREEIDRAVAVTGCVDAAQRTLVESVVFGGEALDTNTKQAFLRAGLLHVLAASGANALVLAGALRWTVGKVMQWLRLPLVCWVGSLLAVLWGFAGLCGFTVSIVRAVLMISYQSLALLCARRASTGTSMWFAALAIAVWQPDSMRSASAWLSFAATAAVAAALSTNRQQPARSPGVDGRLSRLGRVRVEEWLLRGLSLGGRAVWSGLRTSLFVELAVWPLTASLFGQVTPYSVVSNLVAEPLVAVLLPAACMFLGSAVLALYLPCLTPLAHALGWPVRELLNGLGWWVSLASDLPWALLSVRVPSGPWLLLYYGGFWWLLRHRSGAFRRLVAGHKHPGKNPCEKTNKVDPDVV